MQQRRLRLGDIVDDYCPRERRITNHAIVAMIEDQVKQTRCTTCDADHEYKQARIPAQRRKKEASPSLVGDSLAAAPRKRGADLPELTDEIETPDLPDPEPSIETPEHEVAAAAAFENPEPASEPEEAPGLDDEGPVHRRLIRATLPRVEGQTPERKVPEFTIHQRDVNGNHAGRGPRRGPRPGQRNAQHSGGQSSRFGGQRQNQGQGQHGQPSRHGSGHNPRQGSGHNPRHGSGQGGQGEHGNRSSQGQPGQHRHNRGGRKRGR